MPIVVSFIRGLIGKPHGKVGDDGGAGIQQAVDGFRQDAERAGENAQPRALRQIVPRLRRAKSARLSVFPMSWGSGPLIGPDRLFRKPCLESMGASARRLLSDDSKGWHRVLRTLRSLSGIRQMAAEGLQIGYLADDQPARRLRVRSPVRARIVRPRAVCFGHHGAGL